MPKSIAFVTVGSTKFDALIEAVDDPQFADELAAQAFSKLIVQVRNLYFAGMRTTMRNKFWRTCIIYDLEVDLVILSGSLVLIAWRCQKKIL